MVYTIQKRGLGMSRASRVGQPVNKQKVENSTVAVNTRNNGMLG